jgi:hypothetical protein
MKDVEIKSLCSDEIVLGKHTHKERRMMRGRERHTIL